VRNSKSNALKLFGIAVVDGPHIASLAEGTTLIHYRALAAIVQPGDYSSSTLDEKDTDSYATVVEEAFKHGAVLPAPPGTVFKSERTLADWLELHYFTLTDALSTVEGHLSARVTITAGRAVTDNGATKSFQALGAESLRMLRGHSTATVVLPLAEEDTKEGMVVKASFLVDNEKWPAFQESVAAERRRHPALDLQLTGPWPPYDFVRMQFGT
jgi:Gas vesicle synthesis protein GvpL/GvpF.